MRRHSRDRVDELSERKADVIRLLSKWSMDRKDSSQDPSRTRNCSSSIEEFCPIAPPLEDFMRLPSDVSRALRTKRFFEDVRKGDVVYAVVTSKLASGLSVQLLACDWSVMARSIDDLEIKAFCPSDHMPTANPRQDPVETYRVEDTIRSTVLSVQLSPEKVVLSLSHLDLADPTSKSSLGLVSHDELPKYYRQISRDPAESSVDLASYVRRQREFRNPAFLEMMRDHLEIPTEATTKRWYSLLPGYCGKQIRPEDSAEELTTIQSTRWSMKSVEEGIKLMKEGNIPGALASLNKAVEMSKKNVEALVARGALFARKEDFQRAIRDFEEALKLNRSHRNARKYLADTFYHLGQKFEADEPSRALKLFKDALRLDPKFDEAAAAEKRLTKHTQKREKSDGKSATKEPPEKPSSSTAEKLRQMLLTDNGKSNSKRARRSPSRSTSPEDDRKRSRRPPSPRPSAASNGLTSRQDRSENGSSRSVEAQTLSREMSRTSTTNKPVLDKREDVRTRRSPVVQVDVDDLEAQLEAFRASKKAQMLATNKDIHKRTFL